jgi:very-short-patch-repair endonuclease
MPKDLFQRIIEKETGILIDKEVQFHSKRKFKFDYAIPELKIAIEQEGGVYTKQAHGSVTGILRDIEKYTLAASCGWVILRFLPNQMLTDYAFDTIKRTVKSIKEDRG